MTLEGYGVPGGDGQGQGGDENSPAAHVTANAGPEQGPRPEYGRPGLAAQPRNHENGTSGERGGGGEGDHASTPEADAAAATGARPEHSVISNYGLLAPVEPTGDQANGKKVAK